MTTAPAAAIFGDHSFDTAAPADIRQMSTSEKSWCSSALALSVLSPKLISLPWLRREASAISYFERAVTANPSDETAAQALAQLRERVATRFKAAAEGGAQPAARAGAAARTLPRASRER